MKQFFGLGLLVLLVVGFGVLVASSGSSGADDVYGRGVLSQEDVDSEKYWKQYRAKREEMKRVDDAQTSSIGEHVQVFISERDDVLEFQHDINTWLEMNPGIEITARTQSSAGEYRKSTTVVLWYRRDSERKLPLWGLW